MGRVTCDAHVHEDDGAGKWTLSTIDEKQLRAHEHKRANFRAIMVKSFVVIGVLAVVVGTTSAFLAVARDFIVVTLGVAAVGETVAVVNKVREDRACLHHSVSMTESLRLSENPSVVVDTAIDDGAIEGFEDCALDLFPLVERGIYVNDDDACSLLAQTRTVVRPHLRPISYCVVKRLLDLIFSSIVIVTLAIPTIVVCAVIAIDSPGAPIYRQRRVARLMPDGTLRTFSMFKFRTMVRGADSQLEQLQDRNDADGPMFKIHDDPRVTRVGSFLRPHSFDELPQFVNVLVGDMSVVGPRPPLPAEVVTYNRREMGRMVVPQGITGYWQVRGRSDTTWKENVRYDLEYVREASPSTDIGCVLNTVVQVFTGRGAY